MGRASKKRTMANIDKILQMNKEGYNIAEISEAVGVFRRNIKKVLKFCFYSHESLIV